MDAPRSRSIAVAAVVTASGSVVVWWLRQRLRARESQDHNQKQAAGGLSISVEDLREPRFRREHPRWNAELVADSKAAFRVSGRDDLYVITQYDAVAKLSVDDRLSSNPYTDMRLVALNTMPKDRHGALVKVLGSYYQNKEIRRLESLFDDVVKRVAKECIVGENFNVALFAKRVHMSNTLQVLLGDAAPAYDGGLLDEMVQLNDDLVTLVAPLGGVGLPCPPLSSWSTLRFLQGGLMALPEVLRFCWKAGLWTALRILQPWHTLPDRSDKNSGVWLFPHLLGQVPRAFCILLELLAAAPLREKPTSPIESFKAAVHRGDISLAEALVSINQLMVNMTSANAICNMVARLATEAWPSAEETALDDFVAEVLRIDAPLQRNPRHTLEEVVVGDVVIPRKASVLLFIGSANVDPAVFEAPMAFRPGRQSANKALTFGAGTHLCTGQYIVRSEMRAILRYLLGKYGSVTVDWTNSHRVCDVDVGNYGFEELYVKLGCR
eukprot:TRINITY_DN56523_c0_g1_i1.p1 TRINITY_DN56523_c0_g1~~TRINITY_DN56523_c0_g1_i1.p1  ORF type:complete len:526 (-),score=107.53 TRINITY_DN56523_c0_g1_i1:128-1612(-)